MATTLQSDIIELAWSLGRWLLGMRYTNSLEIVHRSRLGRLLLVFCRWFWNSDRFFDGLGASWHLVCWLRRLLFYTAWEVAERKIGNGLLLSMLRRGLLDFRHRVFLGRCGRSSIGRLVFW